MSRPGMRFVSIKSVEQQATLMLHKARELPRQTAGDWRQRAARPSFGVRHYRRRRNWQFDELLELAECDTTPPNAARVAVKVLVQALGGLDRAIDDLEKEITSGHAQSEMSWLLDKVPGIGKMIASVIPASVLDPSAFKSCRDFAAWLGLTPGQNSTGGKRTLGAMTKQGNQYIRKLAHALAQRTRHPA